MKPALAVGRISLVPQEAMQGSQQAPTLVCQVSKVLPAKSHIVAYSAVPPVSVSHLNWNSALSLWQVGRATSGKESLTRSIEHIDYVTWKPVFLVPVDSPLKQQ